MDSFDIVRKMKLIVPEFKSKNSVYETIDFEIEETQESVKHGNSKVFLG